MNTDDPVPDKTVEGTKLEPNAPIPRLRVSRGFSLERGLFRVSFELVNSPGREVVCEAPTMEAAETGAAAAANACLGFRVALDGPPRPNRRQRRATAKKARKRQVTS